MFSSRFHWDSQANRLTRALAARRSSGQPVFDLTESNPTHARLEYPSGFVSALSDPALLSYDPAPAGLPVAREAVCAYYGARGISVSADRIVLTASTSEAYAYLFKLLADPGDEVLVPRPSYPLFEYLATMESVEARAYPLAYHGTWGIDLPSIEAAVTSNTRAIVLVNPNNPTGSFVKRAELAALVDLCRGRGLALISDEVFSDYAFGPDPERVTTVADVDGCLTFAMSGLSKAAGLPQMKLGWLTVNGPAPLREEALAKLEWIADTYLSVSTPVQCAAARLLAAGEDVQRQIRDRAVANLAFARSIVEGSPANLLHVEGGWYITLHVPRTRSEEEWALLLLEKEGVLVQPGFFYDFQTEPYLVVSLLTAPPIFHEGLTRLLRIISCYPHSR
jgi:aspartate/methionine/tyrosine aminotransferase